MVRNSLDVLFTPEVLHFAQKYSDALKRIDELEGMLRDARQEIESLEYVSDYWKRKATS